MANKALSGIAHQISPIQKKLLLSLAASAKPISGEFLAKELGVSRAAVWKQLAGLKKFSIPIMGSPHRGYLCKNFDLSLLSFEPAHYFLEVESTQILAKQAAEKGALEGELWVAERQRNGKGRLSRHWESPVGGLWFSIVLKPALSPQDIGSLSLLAGLTMAQSINDLYQLPIKLKWPNDLVIQTPKGWRKVSGLLTELSAEVGRIHWIVLGIGVNCNNNIPSTLSDIAESMYKVTSKKIVRADLLKHFVETFSRTYKLYIEQGFSTFNEAYWRSYFAPGGLITLKTARGIIQGRAVGVDRSGALLVESENSVTSYFEGEIIL